jgi:RpiB/LacA/LacB family sugar-phosphate isomerase
LIFFSFRGQNVNGNRAATAAAQTPSGDDAMKIVIAADSAGKPLLDVIASHLAKRSDCEITDLSASGFYADIAASAARRILTGEFERGVLFCGTGIGVAISANKVPGIRAAQTHDAYSAERAAKSNNAHIITLGARVVGPELAKSIVDAYLASEFDPQGSSAANVEAVDRLDAGK